MLTFEEARARLLAQRRTLATERVPVSLSVGRVLGEPVLARSDLPPYSYSAMDGYALRSETLAGPLPITLPVVGESRTGRSPEALVPGTAARIFTGAELPSGADAVIAQEDVERTPEGIVVREAPRGGQHVRRAGEDLAGGATALGSGKRLGAPDLALLSALDVVEVAVSARPRVTVLATGDELRPPGGLHQAGKIPDALSLPLAVLAHGAGADARVAPFVGDDVDATKAAVAAALGETDVLVTIGGVSVGDHDLVRSALESQGVALDFWKVAIKPGKPLASGIHVASGTLVLALPGNPASAIITFALFGVPLLRALQGDQHPLPRAIPLSLAAAVRRKPGRLEFLRAVLEDAPGGPLVRPLENQASGALTSLAWADALAMIPADTGALDAGAKVDVIRFQDL